MRVTATPAGNTLLASTGAVVAVKAAARGGDGAALGSQGAGPLRTRRHRGPSSAGKSARTSSRVEATARRREVQRCQNGRVSCIHSRTDREPDERPVEAVRNVHRLRARPRRCSYLNDNLGPAGGAAYTRKRGVSSGRSLSGDRIGTTVCVGAAASSVA